MAGGRREITETVNLSQQRQAASGKRPAEAAAHRHFDLLAWPAALWWRGRTAHRPATGAGPSVQRLPDTGNELGSSVGSATVEQPTDER